MRGSANISVSADGNADADQGESSSTTGGRKLGKQRKAHKDT
jgi:hypothetical protein